MIRLRDKKGWEILRKRSFKVVTDAGAGFIKTSTGFGINDATLEDIKLFKNTLVKM